jgi:hypothetical protein
VNADSQPTVTGIRLGPAFPSDPRSSNPVRREYGIEIYERRGELRLKSRLRPARLSRGLSIIVPYTPRHAYDRYAGLFIEQTRNWGLVGWRREPVSLGPRGTKKAAAWRVENLHRGFPPLRKEIDEGVARLSEDRPN